MAFTTTSKYATLTPYMLMEFRYADSPTPETYPVNTGSTTVGFSKLINGYISDDVQLFNPVIDAAITNNTTENNVVRIDDTNYISLDSNLIIPFNDFDDNLTSTVNLPVVFPSNINVVYDSVRIHIRAGYNLSNLDGVIVSVKYEDQDESYATVASILIKKGTQQVYTYNTSPVTIGSDIYDKYIEFKVPNLPDMQNKYLVATDSNKSSTLAGLISKSGTGFNSTSPINILVEEVNSITDHNGYPKYGTQNVANFSLEQEDPFKNIGAVIRPSDNGEFFEYFATDDGGFIEDFVLFQNSIGNSYYLYHEIETIEQIGAAFIETSNFTNIQTTAYDTPNLFRPIVRNSSIAVSFILRYTMTLVNNADQTRVIRISGYTSDNPGRYGTKITPIQIEQNPAAHKIYNKVYAQPTINLTDISNSAESKEVIKYANVFIQQNLVTTSINNLVPKSIGNGEGTELAIDTENFDDTIYGKGKATIRITPFDNYFKFVFYTEGSDGVPVKINLETSGDYKIVFINDVGKKIIIPSLVSKNVADPSKGEMAFLVEESISEKILNYKNENFYISNMPIEDTTEVLSHTEAQLARTDIDQVSEGENRLNTVTRKSALRRRKKPDLIKSGSSSVLYRGLWKEDDNTNIQVSRSPRERFPIMERLPGERTYGSNIASNIIPGQSESIVRKTPTVKAITPVSDTNMDEFADVDSTNVINVNPEGSLNGSSLISAVSGLMQAFVAAEWTTQQIYNYFMLPGSVGYVTYPNLTSADFVQAATGILNTSEIDLIIERENERNAVSEEIRNEKIGFKLL